MGLQRGYLWCLLLRGHVHFLYLLHLPRILVPLAGQGRNLIWMPWRYSILLRRCRGKSVNFIERSGQNVKVLALLHFCLTLLDFTMWVGRNLLTTLLHICSALLDVTMRVGRNLLTLGSAWTDTTEATVREMRRMRNGLVLSHMRSRLMLHQMRLLTVDERWHRRTWLLLGPNIV